MRYPEGILDADPDVVAIERQAWFRQYELAVEGGRSLDLPRQRRLIDGIPYPETWPGFMHLIGDEEGYIWTLEYGPKDMISTAMRGIDEPRMALVFHPDGYLLGSVELPARFTPFEIGPDYVLGTEDDDLGVEEVVLYGLDKGRLKE
jgi:hypothetical protein